MSGLGEGEVEGERRGKRDETSRVQELYELLSFGTFAEKASERKM